MVILTGISVKVSRDNKEQRGISHTSLESCHISAKIFATTSVGRVRRMFSSSRITDTDAAHKITIYVDGQVRNEAQLAARLEKELPDPVRMVQIHPFSYAMFGSAALKAADLFIVPDSDRDQFADWFHEQVGR